MAGYRALAAAGRSIVALLNRRFEDELPPPLRRPTAVLAGTATGRPKSADGEVETIRDLRAARRSAVKARTMALNQIKRTLALEV